jgi:hypothetical protein
VYVNIAPVASFVVAEIVPPFSDKATDDQEREPAAERDVHDAP